MKLSIPADIVYFLKIINDNSSDYHLSMLVGGFIRDYIKFNKLSNDIDISTVLDIDTLIKKIKNALPNIKIIEEYRQYGTIVVIYKQYNIEITRTRKDITCYGRHADVLFCDNFETDSARRDFTFNALYGDITGRIHDFHDGINDLRSNRVRFIGNPLKRIQEDYLRIIRYFRFKTLFTDHSSDTLTNNAIQLEKHNIANISRERIRNEIFKVLLYSNYIDFFQMISSYDLLEEILCLSSSTTIDFKTFILYNNSLSAVIRLYFLFNKNINILEELSRNLKFTRIENNLLKFLIKYDFIFNSEKLSMDDKYLLFIADSVLLEIVVGSMPNSEKKETITTFIASKQPLPINGTFFKERGFSGLEIKDKLREFTIEFIKHNNW